MDFMYNSSWQVSIPQDRKAVNFGKGYVSTYGLMNCIAVGGIIHNPINKQVAVFMTHRSPMDVVELISDVSVCVSIIKQKFLVPKLSQKDRIYVFGIEPDGRSSDEYLHRGKSHTYTELLTDIKHTLGDAYKCPAEVQEYGWYNKHYLQNSKDPNLCGKATVHPKKGALTYFRDE